ncbi:MAG: encapsulin [Gammaproteobacteria bacterium]
MNEESKMEPLKMERESMTKTGYEGPMKYGRVTRRMGTNMNLGREKLPWSQEIWDRIDQAVHAECQRTKIGRRVLPLYGPVSPGEVTVPSDTIVRDGETLVVNEAATHHSSSSGLNSL